MTNKQVPDGLDEKGLLLAMSEFVTHRGNGSYSVMGEHTAKCALDAIKEAGFTVIPASPSPSVGLEVVADERIAALVHTQRAAARILRERGDAMDGYHPSWPDHMEAVADTISSAQAALAAVTGKLEIAERNRDASRANFLTMQQAAATLSEKLAAAEAQVLRLTEENEALKADHRFMADFVRPRIPEGQNIEQAEGFLAWIGMIVRLEERGDKAIARAETAEARVKVLEEAVQALMSAETVSVHVGYDSAAGGGNYVYADAIRTDSDEFVAARAALKENAL